MVLLLGMVGDVLNCDKTLSQSWKLTSRRVPGIHSYFGENSNDGLITYGNEYDYLNRSHKTQTKWIAGSQIACGHCIDTQQYS